MKITFSLLFAALIQVSAAGFAQKITFTQKDATLKQVFNEINKQTGYNVFWSPKLIKNSQKRLDVNFIETPLEDALSICLKGRYLTYSIDEKTIIIKETEKYVLNNIINNTIDVEGKVVDEKGLPLPGAGVKLKGTSTGTVTDINGQYAISVPDEKAVLVFSFIGFVPQEISINGRTNLNVVLVEEQQALSEMVVVGYGTQKKINLTGAVDVVSGEQLANRAATKVADLIKGASPNLNITSNFRGGEPGAGSNWNVRGVGSIQGNASPLVLVDGVEIDLNNIDPESIESVSVLKDASASAIYGSRAPFGVILITTKKGGKSQQVRVQYNSNLSAASPIKLASQVDALTWSTAYNQANANAGLNPIYADEQMERIRGYMAGTYPHEYDPNNPINNIFAGRRNGNANNNWPQLFFKDFSFSQKHNINVSGGNESTQYYLAGGIVDQNGMYAYGYDYYKRYNFLTNFSSQVTKWLSLNSSLKYAKSNTDYPLGITTVGRDYTFGEFITWSPMTPMYNINGTIQSSLIRMMQDGGRDKAESNDFIIALGTQLEPLKGWKTNISYNHNVQTTRGTVNPKPVMVELGTGGFGNIGKPNAAYQSIFFQPTYSLFNVVSSYEKALSNHYFNVLAGYEQEEKFYSNLQGTGTSLITTAVPSLSTALGDKTLEDRMWHWATQGIFGRLNYNFKEKYLLEFSARYNGSSRFAKESRWGFFPSASAGYNLSKEKFWDPIKPYVDMFKLRGSYGSLGNQNVSNYLYLSTIGVTPELNWILDGQRPPYASVPAIISNDLTWETITTLNLGFDAGMLSNRLRMAFDWYKRETTDMIGPSETLPYLLGAPTPFRNNAALSTKGFEIALSWDAQVSPAFSYNAKVSIGDSKSTILKYKNDKGLIDTWYNGKQFGEIWGFVTDGIIQTQGEAIPDQSRYYSNWGPGDMKYKDLNGDGIINDGSRTIEDHGDLTVIGNTSPRYNYGFTAGINWKGFDFSMFWQGLGKHDYYPHTNASMFWGMTRSFGSSSLLKNSPALNYWRPANETNILGPNTDAYFPKPYFSAQTDKNRQTQSKYVLNGAYLRLKNLHVGYTVPQKLSSKLFVQKARIYMSGENLLSISGLPKNYDPEAVFAANLGSNAPGAIYPLSSFLSLGFNLTF